MLCSLLVLLVLVVLARSGLPVLVLVLVLVLFVLVLFVPAVLSVVVLTVLAVLVLVDSRLLAEAFCAANRSVPTLASSSSVASIARGAPCWRRWVSKTSSPQKIAVRKTSTRDLDAKEPQKGTFAASTSISHAIIIRYGSHTIQISSLYGRSRAFDVPLLYIIIPYTGPRPPPPPPPGGPGPRSRPRPRSAGAHPRANR